VALALDPEHAAHLAYISGVFGVYLKSAPTFFGSRPLLHSARLLQRLRGAGTFDGIFMTPGLLPPYLA